MRSPSDESVRPIRSLLRRLIKAPAALSVVWPAILVLSSYVAWHRWGSEHVAAKFQQIDLASIQTTPPPSYVRSNVPETVYRDTAMEELSLLDRGAAAKIASAFALHPWVRRVHGVRKLPGGTIDVRLEYRQPVAMARVYKPEYQKMGGEFFLPLDAEGVILPAEEFARSETDQFIHIDVPGATSNRWPGGKYGDPRIEAAAMLAGLLAPYRQQAGIQTILVSGDHRVDLVPQLSIVVADPATGTAKTLHWGYPPGMEPPGEATPGTKLQTLLNNPADITDLRVARSPTPIR